VPVREEDWEVEMAMDWAQGAARAVDWAVDWVEGLEEEMGAETAVGWGVDSAMDWEVDSVMDWEVDSVMATVEGWEAETGEGVDWAEEKATEEAKEEEKVPVPARDSGAGWGSVPAPVPGAGAGWAAVPARERAVAAGSAGEAGSAEARVSELVQAQELAVAVDWVQALAAGVGWVPAQGCWCRSRWRCSCQWSGCCRRCSVGSSLLRLDCLQNPVCIDRLVPRMQSALCSWRCRID
jgi:hypothetical protein